jgi:L-amino acid N-acyltransferase
MRARAPPPETVRVRRATARDLASITRIYNDAVRTTTATFDTRPRRAAAARRWFSEHGRRFPLVVAERAGAIVGWASIGPWSDRPAYAGTGEVSTYVARAERGRGIGTALLRSLVDLGTAAGLRTLVARVVDGNAASLRLHRSAGFREIGVMREVGRKFDRWLDVRLLQRMLRAPAAGGARPRAPPRRGRGRD